MATKTICSNIFNGELFRKRCVNFEHSPYLEPYLTYQYSNEPIQIILGADSYTVEQQPPPFTGGQCPNVQYRVVIKAIGVTTHTAWTAWGCGVTVQWTSAPILGKIKGIVEKPDNRIWIQYVHPTLGDKEDIFSLTATESIFWASGCFRINNPYRVLQGTAHIIGIIRADGQPDNCGNLPTPCDFKAYKQGQLVHSETRNVCPDVNLYPCRIEEKFEREIILNPFDILFVTEGGTGTSEIAELIQFYINSIILGGSELAQEISNRGVDFVEDIIDGQPDNCILLWKFHIDLISFGFEYIAQYCSHETCPQPQWLADCKNCGCPDGTCEVKCGDKTCCYDKNGKAVEMF